MVEREKRNTDNKLFITYLFLVVGLIVLGANNSTLTLFALILSCAYILFTKSNNNIISMLFFILPFSPVFKFGVDSNTLFNVLILLSIFKLAIPLKKLKIPYKIMFSFLLLFIYSLLNGGAESLVSLVKVFMYFILMYLIFLNKRQINLYTILSLFSIGIITSSFAGLFSDFILGLNNYLGAATIRMDSGDHFDRFSGVQFNPNFFTMDISIALSGWVGLLIKRKVKKIDYLIIILLIVFGLMSLSQSFLITLLLLLVVLMISLLKENVVGLIRGIFLILILLIGSYLIIDKEYIHVFLSRLPLVNSNNESLSSLTTGRFDIWVEYLKLFYNDLTTLFFGQGIGATSFRATHNYFIETIYYLGLVGSILYIFCIKSLLPNKRKHQIRNLLNYLPLLILLFRGLGIELFTRENLIFYFVLIGFILNINYTTTNFTSGLKKKPNKESSEEHTVKIS